MNQANFKKLSKWSKQFLAILIFALIFSSCSNGLPGTYVNDNSAIKIESMGDERFSVQMSSDLTKQLGIRTILSTNEKASDIVGSFHYGANKNELVFDKDINVKLILQNNTIIFQNRVFSRD